MLGCRYMYQRIRKVARSTDVVVVKMCADDVANIVRAVPEALQLLEGRFVAL